MIAYTRLVLRKLVSGTLQDIVFRHMLLRTGLPVANNIPEFTLDDTLTQQQLVDALGEHGVIVVSGLLTDTECDAFQTKMLDVFAACNQNWDKHQLPATNGHGLMKFCGIPLSHACQSVRTHPKVMQLGQLLYNINDTADMVCSLDAPALGVVHQLKKPPKDGNKYFAGSSLKPHVDLAIATDDTKTVASQTLIPYLQSTGCTFPVQMQVLTMDQMPDGKGGATPGFVAAPGWHNKLEVRSARTDFRPLDESELQRVMPHLAYIPAKKGSAILWHSGLPHTSYRGDPDHPAYKNGLCRATQMVCYGPKEARDSLAKKRKLACFGIRDGETSGQKLPKEGACTTHWPHVAVTEGPGHYSNSLDEFRIDKKTGQRIPIRQRPGLWKILPPGMRTLTPEQEQLL